MSKTSIRTAAGRRAAQPPRSNMADHTVDIRAWAQMLVERGNRLFERAERERMTLIGTRQSSSPSGDRSASAATSGRSAGESRRGRGKDSERHARPG